MGDVQKDLKIRWLKSNDSDLAEIAQVLNSADSEVSIKDFSAESLSNFLSDEKRVYLLAYLGKEIVGATHAYFLVHPAGVTYVYVDEVDTVASHRRKGVAKAMMQEIFKLAKERGVDEVWLGTEHDNIAANALYNSMKPSEVEHGPIYSYKVKD